MKDGNDKKANKTKRIESDFFYFVFFTAMDKSFIIPKCFQLWWCFIIPGMDIIKLLLDSLDSS